MFFRAVGLVVAVVLMGCEGYRSFDFVLPHGAALRTDGVYINQTFYRDEQLRRDHTRPVYAYIRFFQDGRCFFSHERDGYASPQDLVSISADGGEHTFYSMTGDTVVVQYRYHGHFTHRIFHLRSDSLWQVAQAYQGLLGLTSETYQACASDSTIFVFMPMQLTTRPDW